MTQMNRDFDDLRLDTPEGLDEFVRRSDEMLNRLSGVQYELGAIMGEGEAADGMARAVVDSTGRLERVTLDPRIARLDTATIAEAVTEAVRAAQDDARRRSEELISEATGGEPITLDMAAARRQLEEIGEDLARTLRDLSSGF
ncbi:YbaB/EbfC family nucleoid-associated protein [Streptosporangium sp. NPDC001559]|uniref:YbaB/EbfC family nucleoid-associated protein n=1 Tax=Streptosporangium sp. NPDC001559 TaxID=3366187 RepID=UPI0036E74ED6